MGNLGQIFLNSAANALKLKAGIESYNQAQELANKYKLYGQMAQKVMEAPPDQRPFLWKTFYSQLPDDYKTGVSPDYDPNELKAFLAKSAAGYLYLQHKLQQLKNEYTQAGTGELLSRAYLEQQKAYCETHQNDPRCNYVLARDYATWRHNSVVQSSWDKDFRSYFPKVLDEIIKGKKIANIGLSDALNRTIRTYGGIDKLIPLFTKEAYNYKREYALQNNGALPPVAEAVGEGIKRTLEKLNQNQQLPISQTPNKTITKEELEQYLLNSGSSD